MEDSDELNTNTTAFVIFLLILSAIGILWAVSCSWLSGRKKRLRVANNPDVDGLVLQIANPMNSSRAKAPDRYSVSEQVIILPIDDHGQNLQVPTIVITPPSPHDLVVDVTSIRSDSSIGSADDLILNGSYNIDDGGVFDEIGDEYTDIGAGLGRGGCIRDSMRNTLNFSSRSSMESNNGTSSKRTAPLKSPSRCSIGRSGVSNGASIKGNGISGATSAIKTETCSIISISGNNIDDDVDDDEFFNLDNSSPRPRLSSMEPGTKKPIIQISQGR